MPSETKANIYKFNFISINGDVLNLDTFKGKPILIVNTASLCGFTNQYKDLEDLHLKYKSKGLIVIGIPSNDFGSQELETNKKVKEFCETNFDVSFLLTGITKIKGQKGHPFFKWVLNQNGLLSFPKWNFYKYLIDKNGNVHSWYTSMTNPKSKKITLSIEELILKE